MSTKKTLGLAGNYMDVEETIHVLKELEKAKLNYESQSVHRAIYLLQQGEKYEAMWQTLLEDLDFMPNKEKLLMSWGDFNDLMIKIKQKYFPPKEAKQDYSESEE